MVYMSPEMVLSDSFAKLWKDSHFRSRLTAIIVDEAHCIDEWGGEDFRPEYRHARFHWPGGPNSLLHGHGYLLHIRHHLEHVRVWKQALLGP